MQQPVRLLGISGSLRPESNNTAILRAIQSLLPDHVTLDIFEELGAFPHFNTGSAENEAVSLFKQKLANSDGVFISTPEYAFGVPGVLKNALDWCVGTGEFNEKPVAVISASPLNTGGAHAMASLLLTLTALGSNKSEATSLSIANVKLKFQTGGPDAETSAQLQQLVDQLLSVIAVNSK